MATIKNERMKVYKYNTKEKSFSLVEDREFSKEPKTEEEFNEKRKELQAKLKELETKYKDSRNIFKQHKIQKVKNDLDILKLQHDKFLIDQKIDKKEEDNKSLKPLRTLLGK